MGIDLEEMANTVTISVRDRGKGIPTDEQGRIFEPFYRLQKERSGDSFGIDLSIVAEIAAAQAVR